MTQEPNDPAVPPDAESRRRIEEQELLGVLMEEQHRDDLEEAIPAHAPTLLLRLRLPLECLGGILLGVNIAVITLIFNFILFNYLLHMEF